MSLPDFGAWAQGKREMRRGQDTEWVLAPVVVTIVVVVAYEQWRRYIWLRRPSDVKANYRFARSIHRSKRDRDLPPPELPQYRAVL